MADTFLHPQFVGDRAVWLDGDILRKIQQGDPTKGWEGDENLAVFWNPHASCFELMRWENGDYSLVARQRPGVVFDERIIEELVRRDMRRTPKRDLHAEVVAHNEAVDRRRTREFEELAKEEVLPRIRRSLRKEGMI